MFKNYIQTNGNGTITATKTVIAIWSLIILVIGMIIPAVFAYGKLNENVNDLQKQVDLIKPDVEEMETHIATSNIRWDNIYEDIQEIKADVKEIKKELKGG